MKYVDKLLKNAQETWEDGIVTLQGLPDPNNHVDYASRYQFFKNLLESRFKMGEANGVFKTLATISTDERREKRQERFENGEGI